MLEVSAQGTAIHWEGAPASSPPFVSALSGQEFWALLSAGYRQVVIAFGTCVDYQVTSANTRWVTNGGLLNGVARSNQELTEHTAGLIKARRHAICYMEEQAALVRAEGVVGMRLDKRLAIHEVEIEVNETKQRRNDLIARFSAVLHHDLRIEGPMNKTLPCHAALSLMLLVLPLMTQVLAADTAWNAKNPILWADVPDMAIIRVGDTYYMSSTTMHLCPGLPIMKSKDLVNWQIASYAYETLADTDELIFLLCSHPSGDRCCSRFLSTEWP